MTQTNPPLTLESEEIFQALHELLHSLSGGESVGEGFQAALEALLSERFATKPEWLLVKHGWESIVLRFSFPSFFAQVRDPGEFYQMDELDPSPGEVKVLTERGEVRCFDYTAQNGWELREERGYKKEELGEIRHFAYGALILSPIAWLVTPPTSFEEIKALLTRAADIA